MALVDPSGTPIASTPLTEEQLIALAVEEMRRTATADGPAILMFEPDQLFTLVGLLQLAGRHPDLSPANRESITNFVDSACEYFAECPTVLDVIQRGEDPHFDV